jgi:hypothetical protein
VVPLGDNSQCGVTHVGDVFTLEGMEAQVCATDLKKTCNSFKFEGKLVRKDQTLSAIKVMGLTNGLEEK